MAESSVVTFAGLLRQLRTEAGLTQEELAAAARLSARSVSDLERGVALTARKETARLLADALNLTGAARASFEAAARGRAAPGASPGLDGEAAQPGGVAAATRALPRDIGSFTGRKPELRRLAEVSAGSSRPGVVSIHAIGGMAGVGKTALAVHAAHQLAPHFPDGQIFLSLHGHTPGQRPVDPADALASLLLTAGVAAAQIPPGLEARTALWRDRLAGKQLLLLLDDAANSEQVRPLLPASAGSLVLVTSRRHLTALEDAQTISLDILPAGQAAELLVRLADRLGLDPADPEVAEITRLCGYLPLAIGMLARQLHHHPAWTAAELAADLAAARDRLQLLHAENMSVAAAFDLSYAELTPVQQRLFRRLGLHPGAEIDGYAAAALDGTALATGRRHLEALYDQYLIAEPARGRYRLHDLIREHAHTLASADDPAENDAATSRLLDYYTYTAHLADARLARQTRPHTGVITLTAPAAAPDLPDDKHALAWARAERANLLACLDQATRASQHERVIALTAGLAAFLRHDGPWAAAITRHTAAVQAARYLGDRLAEANALNDLAVVLRRDGDHPGSVGALDEALGIYRDLGDKLGQANALCDLGDARRLGADYPAAAGALEEALGIYRDLGDRPGQAMALNYLGNLRHLTGDHMSAVTALEEALGIFREVGDRPGQASALNNLGNLRNMTGDRQGAVTALQEALATYRDLGNQLGQASALSSLGAVQRLTGDYQGAVTALEEALGIFRDLGDRLGQAYALGYLGMTWRLAGDYEEAAEALEETLSICRDLGDRGSEADTLNELGTLHRLRGDLDQAGTCHRQALGLARDIDSPWDEARALAGLGRCALAAGHTADAATSLRQALEIFERIGAAEAAEVALELEALARPQQTGEQ